jgi:phosphoglycerate dehydrogenase-like enzyme
MPAHSSVQTVLIASFLEAEHVQRIRQVDERLRVIYEPDLLRPPRYAADHTGGPMTRSPEQEARWQALLGQADILFDFDHTHREDLPELAPNLRWLQATSAGIGQFVKRMGYDVRMPSTLFTTASGVHSAPLAEFCLMSILNHYRGLAHLQECQRAHHWERFATTDLQGKTVGIIGLGKIGAEVARLCAAFGMTVIGVKNTPSPVAHVDQIFAPHELPTLLPQMDVVIMIVPHTPASEKMVGAPEFAAMKDGAFFINIGRGSTVDEAALIAALQHGKLGGAALDVFEEEPLPTDSPLWDMANVLICPHSASTSDRENARITDLFCDNLRRYLDGRPLRNVLDTERLY